MCTAETCKFARGNFLISEPVTVATLPRLERVFFNLEFLIGKLIFLLKW